MSTSLPSTAYQQGQISASLNSTMMGIFLMGIYTVVYFGTLYIYLSRKASQRLMITAVITMLFILGISQLGIQWYLTTFTFVNNGDTRESVWEFLYEIPIWVQLVSSIASFGMVLLADSLIIWRCFHVWGRSFRIILLPSLLFVGEFALYLATIILQSIIMTHLQVVTDMQAQMLNSIQSAFFFVSAGTSLMTTYLIAHRIYSISDQDKASSRRFRYIVQIVVESALVYSLALVISAVSSVIIQPLPSLAVFAFDNYGGALVVPITGIAPTVMVARVALAASNIDNTDISIETRHLTGLQFNGRSTTFNETVGSIRSIRTVKVVNGLPHEGEKEMV